MNKREVVQTVLAHRQPPYVPWSYGFTLEAAEKLSAHFGVSDIRGYLDNHLLHLGNKIGFFNDLGDNRVQDAFGVVWNREVDKDIGIVEATPLPAPSLQGYQFPDPESDLFFKDIPAQLHTYPEVYRVFTIGFSLYERAWSLRGMENLLMDFYENPEFTKRLLRAISDFNIAQASYALDHFDLDAVYFGDDWGQQHGLIMGPKVWHEFIYPELKRMYRAVKDRGKRVVIHSCGDVQELIDDLIEIGLDCFNPFQPEVMDVEALHSKYYRKLSFFGGLSTQQTLPFGTPEDVRRETRRLIEMGSKGGYILSPAHAVEGDVPLENMLAFIEVAQEQIS